MVFLNVEHRNSSKFLKKRGLFSGSKFPEGGALPLESWKHCWNGWQGVFWTRKCSPKVNKFVETQNDPQIAGHTLKVRPCNFSRPHQSVKKFDALGTVWLSLTRLPNSDVLAFHVCVISKNKNPGSLSWTNVGADKAPLFDLVKSGGHSHNGHSTPIF